MTKPKQQNVSIEQYVDSSGSKRRHLLVAIDVRFIFSVLICTLSLLSIVLLYRASRAPRESDLIRNQIIALSHDYLDAVAYEAQMEELRAAGAAAENSHLNDLHMTLAVILKNISGRLAGLESIAARCNVTNGRGNNRNVASATPQV